MERIRKAEFFGFANATVANPSASDPRTYGAEQLPVAAATDTKKLLKRSQVMAMHPAERSQAMAMHPAERSLRFTRHGRRCMPDVEIRITTDSTAMAGAASRFVSNGRLSRGFLQTWERRGCLGCQSTVSTTTATMSQVTADGRRQKSRPQIAGHGVEALASLGSKISIEWKGVRHNGCQFKRRQYGKRCELFREKK